MSAGSARNKARIAPPVQEKHDLLALFQTILHKLLQTGAENGTISQKTEDLVGPYELLDFFLYHMMRYGEEPEKVYRLAKYAFQGTYTDEVILKWLRTFYWRFFSQQFKRSCLPDGPKVGSVAVSPRGDLRMPSDASIQIWKEQLDRLG